MLTTLGRGLAPVVNHPLFPFKRFNFTQSLPAEVVFSRNSAATLRNTAGKLISVSANQPRFDHTSDGTPLGLLIEPSATNKCENFNINPTDTTGFTTSGSGTLSVVDDTTDLANAGLNQICTSGKVFKATATTASTFIVYAPGTVGNLNAHSLSLYARGDGVGSRTARLSVGGTMLSIAPAGDDYKQYKHENLVPNSTGRKLTLSIDGNETLYFILYQLEEGDYCTSVIPTNGGAVTRATDRAYISDVDQHGWFNPNQGYMICRYSQERLLNADAYAAVLNDGSSANTIGLRLDTTNHNLRAYMRANSSSEFTSANLDYQIERTLNAGAIKWNTETAEIISGGETTSDTITQNPININTLEIGARNGGSSPMHGHIQSIEVGTQELTLKQLGNKIQNSNDMMIIGAGQSLARGHFKSQASNSEVGKQKHREIIGQTKRNSSIVLIDGSTGGSAASKTSSDVNYWWDLATSTRGPSLDTFYQEINDVGAKPTIILWAQGEEDSHKIGISTSTTQYKQALEAIFADMRASLGDIKIYIQRIGRRSAFANPNGVQAIRDIQKEIITENSWCYEAAEIYDLALYDQVHLTDSGYVTAAQRNSMALLEQGGAVGPNISSALRSGTSITATLTHDAGTDFTPSTAIEGFKFFDDGTEISITNAIRENSTTITLTLDSAPVSGIEILYYGHDDMAGIDVSNIIIDNALTPMPLRTSKTVL